jgi:putative integral membrane protein (TIGR02587 family)
MTGASNQLRTGLGRAFGGALVFSLPMLMTMEMWDLGFAMERWKAVLLLAASLPMLMFLSHYSGFERTWDWREDARDVAIAYGVGLLTSAFVLGLLGIVGAGMSLSEIAGKVGLQSIPGALGALLGRSQFGKDAKDSQREQTFFGELGIMMIGALFLALNVAPTEEMVLISYRMTSIHTLAFIPATLLIMHVFVYATEFSSSTELTPDTPWWSAFLRFTLVGYAVSLLVALYLLWTFGHLDGVSAGNGLRVVVVLGFPAAIGAAAARLIL